MVIKGNRIIKVIRDIGLKTGNPAIACQVLSPAMQ